MEVEPQPEDVDIEPDDDDTFLQDIERQQLDIQAYLD